jgi:hypothetical protein
VDAAIWSLIELSLAIVAASLPTLRALLPKIIPPHSSNFSRQLYLNSYVRQGDSQGIDVEAGTGGPRYLSADDSTASVDALYKDADYQLHKLGRNDKRTNHDATTTYIGTSDLKAKDMELEVGTEKGNGIRAITIVTQEIVKQG